MNREPTDPPRPLFDHYDAQYETLVSRAVNVSGEDVEYFARYKLERIRELYGSCPPPRHIVDIGCGVGLLTEHLARAWPSTRITGLDLSPNSLEQAAARCAGRPNVTLSLYDGHALPSAAREAELVILANVLHHVEVRARPALMDNVVLPALRSGGRLVVFEHNPYNPVTRRAVRLCPFDRDAHLLALRTTLALVRRPTLRTLGWSYIVFFPNCLRGLRRWEPHLRWLPLGAQYMVVAQREEP